MSQSNDKGYEYLNPEFAMKDCDPKSSCGKGKQKVKCYNNGLWWACPNPLDKDRAGGVEDAYNKGYFLIHRTCCVDIEEFKKRINWNS
jgi:hypothetical protein